MNKEVKCEYCGKEKNIPLSVYKSSKTKRFFCNKDCKAEWQKGRSITEETREKMRAANSGKNNGNYKDGHTYEKSYCSCGNEKDYRAKQCNECYLEIMKSNGKDDFLKEKRHWSHTEETKAILREKALGYKNHFKGKEHTKKSKKIIGEKSKAKFTKEFKIKFRKTMEDRGYWIPLNKIDDYKFYYRLCEWQEKMFNLQIEGKELIESLGVFNSFKNTSGVVRDHKLSRKEGLRLKIFPEILRHPCNCQLLTQGDNSSKRMKSSIELSSLFDLIKNYEYKWKEQEECILLIKKYNKGERYDRELYQ